MATTETVHEDREETQAERNARLERERAALKPSPAGDSLRARLLALLGGNQYADIEQRGACSHERRLFKYAAAVTKAVAVASAGAESLTANDSPDVEFTEDDATTVLLGLSALLAEGPDLIEDLRYADPVTAQACATADEKREVRQ